MAQIIEIVRRTLHEEVAGHLRGMLVEGRIPPGAKLNERELCQLLKVSRTPLREAIKRMAAEGLADLEGLSGYYRLNAQIHAAINDAARNPVLAKIYREINARVQSLRFRTNQNGSKWQRAVQGHEQMLVALEARDPLALRAILIGHLLRKRDAILELMRAGDIYSQVALSP